MSQSGKRSLQMVSLISPSVANDSNFRGKNTDRGVESQITNKKFQNKNAHNNKKEAIANIMNILASNDSETHSNVPLSLYDPMIGSRVYKRQLDFNPAVIGLNENFFKLDGYNREELLEYKRRMESILSGEGSLYTFDIETLGEDALLFPNAPQEHKRHRAITEISVWEQKLNKETNKFEKRKIFSLNSAPDLDTFDKYAVLMDTTNSNANTSVLLERLAGYSGDDSIVYNPSKKMYEVKKWTKNGIDISNEDQIRKGLKNVGKLPRRGSDINKKQFQEFVDLIRGIGNQENSVLASINGLAFDIPNVLAEGIHLGIDVKGLFANGHFDVQKIRYQLAKYKSFTQSQEARANGIDVNDSLSLENRNKVNTYIDSSIVDEVKSVFGVDDINDIAHTADYDTFMSMHEAMAVYNDSLDALDVLEESLNNSIDVTNDTLFISNGKFVSKSNSLHFKIEGGEVNSYNSSILQEDGLYTIKASRIKTVDEIKEIISSQGIKGVSDLSESFSDIEGKMLFELTDVFDEDNKVMMFYNSIEDFQKDMIDSGILESTIITDENVKDIIRSQSHVGLDSVRRDIENFGSVSSWKKVDKLENFIEQYNELKNFTVNDGDISRRLEHEEIYELLNGESIIIDEVEYRPEDVLKRLTRENNIAGEKIVKIPKERLRVFKGIYEDLDSNSELYSRVMNEIGSHNDREYITASKDFSTKNDIYQIEKKVNEVKLNDRTVVFGATLDEIEKQILDSKSEYEKLKHIVDKDSEMSNIHTRNLESFEDITEIDSMKMAFKYRYGEDFDLDSDTVNALLRDKEELKTRKIVTSIDILSSNEGYTALSFKDKGKFESDLSGIISMIRDSSNDQTATNRDRLGYADDIAEDLFFRGLLSEADYEKVVDADTFQGKVSNMSELLFRNKETANKIIETSIENVKGINTADEAILAGYNGLKNLYTPEYIDRYNESVKPFVKNRIMSPRWYSTRRSIMGDPLQKYINQLNIPKIVEEKAKANNPNVSVIGNLYYASDNEMEKLFGTMYSKLGWGDSYRQEFAKIMKSKEMNLKIKMKNSDNEVALSKFIVNDGKDYHLLLTTNENFVRQQIADGATIEEISERAVSFKLPKIEEGFGGTRMISQSDTAKKAVTTDIIAVPNEDLTGLRYYSRDTAEEVIESFGSNLGYIKERIAERDIKGANKRARSSWSKINESKSLTATSYKYVDINGELGVDIVYGINRADAAKRTLVNDSVLVHELNTVFKLNDKLKEEFISMFESLDYTEPGRPNIVKSHASELLEEVQDLVSKALNGKSKIKGFHDMGPIGVKLGMFMRTYGKEIAETLAKDKSFMEDRGKEIAWHIEDMIEHGNEAAIVKPGDLVGGHVNKLGVLNYVPHANITNTVRETMMQGMNGHDIYEDSILTAYKHRLSGIFGEVNSAKEVYKKLGIDMGFGVTTPEIMELSKEFYGETKGFMAFTSTVSHMNYKEFNRKVSDIYNNVDGIHDEIKKLLKKEGIDVSSDEIKRVAELISASSSMYEDDGMMNIAVAEIMNPVTVVNQKVYTPLGDLKVGMQVNAGDLLGYDVDGSAILARDKAKIKNIKNGMVIFQLNDENRSIKFNMNHSEKAVFKAPTFNRTGIKEVDQRMIKIISEVQYRVTDGANFAFNPSVKKHDATNTVFLPTEMAIVDAIENDAEAEIVRKAFKKHAPNLDIDVTYDDIRGKYVVLNTPRNTSLEGVDPIKELTAARDSIKDSGGGLGDRVKRNLEMLESKKQGKMDMVIAANNTIERGMDALGEGKGTTISTRGWSVRGVYREFDAETFAKYEGTYFIENIRSEMDKILNANSREAREVANIYAALEASFNEKVGENVVVEAKDIKKVVVPNGLIEADKLDDIFKYNENVNLIELDLSDFNLSAKNPFYVNNDMQSNMSLREVKNLKRHSERVNKIYIPVTMPNETKGMASVSRMQRAQADLIRAVRDARFVKDSGGVSARSGFKKLNEKLEEYFEAMIFELTHVDGKRIKLQKTTQNIGSFRVEAHKIVAPSLNKDGTLDDLAFGSKITKLNKDGSVSYTKSSFINEQRLVNSGVDFDLTGEVILSKQLADEFDQLEFLKKYMKENHNADLSDAKKLRDIQLKIKSGGYDISTSNLAREYFKEIGFESLVSRDPDIRVESVSGSITRIHEGVNIDGAVIDAITSKGNNADIDGDELNISMVAFKEENGKLVLREYNDPVRAEARMDAHGSSNAHNERLAALSVEEELKLSTNTNIYDLKEYEKYSTLKDMVEDGDVSQVTNKSAKTIRVNAGFSKSIVGQTSNPGLYLRGASFELVGDLIESGDVEVAKQINKSIAIGTLILEQSSIDQKLNKFGDKAVKASTDHMLKSMEMSERWRALHSAVKSGDQESIRHATSRVIDMVETYVKEKPSNGKDYNLALVWQNKAPVNGDYTEIIDNILNGRVQRNNDINNVHLEEFLYDAIRTFKHQKSSDYYTSVFNVRNSHAMGDSGEKTLLSISEHIFALKNGGQYRNPVAKLAQKLSSDTFLSSTIMVGAQELENDSKLFIGKSSSDIEEGIYNVTLNGLQTDKHSITLTAEDGTSRTISRDNVFQITKDLDRHDAKILTEAEVGDYEYILFNKYKNKVSEDIISDADLFRKHKKVYDELKGPVERNLTVKESAVLSAFNNINVENLEDIHNTIDVLQEKYILDDRKEIIKQMNDAIRSKGTKEYRQRKKEVILNQEDIKKNVFGNKDKFFSDIERSAVSRITDFSSARESLAKNSRIDLPRIANSREITEIINTIVKENGMNYNSVSSSAVMTRVKGQIMEHFRELDAEAFFNINEVFKRYQNSEEFRKTILNWDVDGVERLLAEGDKVGAIKKMNNMTMIFSRDYSGKKLGHMSLDELKYVSELSDNTGISDDIVRINKSIIDKLITLRVKDGIILENIEEPILKNLKDSIGSELLTKINNEIRKEGNRVVSKNKSTASMVSNIWDTFKSKVSGITPKQKMTAGAMTAVGIGAMAALGSGIMSGNATLRRNNEDESNITNKLVPKAPPSEKKIYVSDSNAINVNVKGRAPIGSSASDAETAISSMFGDEINVNSTISDSRDYISNYEVDDLMSKALR